MTRLKSPLAGPECELWLMIANGTPQIPEITAIKNIFDTPLTPFMIFPPQLRSGKSRVCCTFYERKIFGHSCNLIEGSDSVWMEVLLMMGAEIAVETANAGLSDEEVVRRVIEGDGALFEILMRRYNRRLFRVTRSIVANDLEAEDIIQDAYVRAYQHLNQFEGRARFSTWLTKIAIYEAYARVRRADHRK